MPLCAILSVWPIIEGLPPIEFRENFHVLHLIVLPCYLGVLCSPLYSYVVLFDIKRTTLSGIKLKLVDYSLIGAIIASITGLASFPILVPVPFVVLSIFFSVRVFMKYREVEKLNVTLLLIFYYGGLLLFILGLIISGLIS